MVIYKYLLIDTIQSNIYLTCYLYHNNNYNFRISIYTYYFQLLDHRSRQTDPQQTVYLMKIYLK